MAIIQKIISLVTSLLLLLSPSVEFTPKGDDVLLNVSIISDTHLDYRELIGRYMLADALDDIASSSPAADAVVVSGDLTNYGDEKSLEAFYEIFKDHCTAEKWVIAPGNHDIGHVEDITHEEARQRLIKYYNDYTGSDINNIYYSTDVKGYTFIVLSDQSDDSWDSPDIYEDQLSFLDTELARATSEGKPAFVICHWPIEGVNGQEIIWEDGSIETEFSNQLRAVLEKYENVFFISGHLHAGINGELTKAVFGFSCVETTNGVTYINLPTYFLVNRYGVPWGGMGFQLEVYQNEVVIRARNFATSKWYSCYEFSVPLTAAE